MEPIIDPVDKDLVADELTPQRLLRPSNKGDNEIYIVDAFCAPNTMREIGRLREHAFRAEGGGTGKECDIDEFDTMPVPCRQLIVWNPQEREIIGGYRFLCGSDMEFVDGLPRIATAHLFHFSDKFINEYLPHTLELGRSFVAPEYQSSKAGTKAIYALDNLWDGLAAVTILNPDIKYLFGKFTMYPSYGEACRDMLLGFIAKYFPDRDELAWPIHPLQTKAHSPEVQSMFNSGTYREDFRTLNHAIREYGRNIPPLVNAYIALSPTMRNFGTAINHEFGDVEETGIFFSIDEIFEEKKKRHFDSFEMKL